MQDFLNVEMTDEQIMDLLVEALQDITGFDEKITKETLLIDELGLDSLGFLDLFFTIQTSIQREVTNEQMRNLILEELNLDTDPNVAKLSEGEKDRVAYPRLKVENFFNIVKKQLNPELAGIDLEATSERIFDSEQLDNFLKANFEQIKQEKIAEQLEVNNINDPRMQEIVRTSFDAIDPSKIQSLFSDKKLMVNMVKKYLKEKMDLDNPENLQRFLMGENKDQLQVKAFLQSDNKGRSIFDMFLDQNKSNIYDLYLNDNKETMISKILEERKSQVLSELSGKQDDKNLILKIFDRRRDDILNLMIQKSKDGILKIALDDKSTLFKEEFAKQSDTKDFKDFVWQNLHQLAPEIIEGQRELLEEEILSKGYQIFMGQNDGNIDIKAIFEEEKEALFNDIISREKSTIYKQMVLSDEEKANLMNQLVNDDKLNLFTQFVSENKVSLKREVQQRGLLDENGDFATQLLANDEVQQELMKTLIDSQIGSVFEEEVGRQAEMIEDTEVLNILKDTFLNNEFREDKIKSALSMSNMHGNVVEDFMRNNFDRIAMEETQRLLANKELRNELVQNYIKENYDPMEAMQLNDPEKMKELQQKITEKYMQDNLDEIISRYMNDYMNEMMDAIPEEEIEVDGDVQEEFMKKFMAQLEAQEGLGQSQEVNDLPEKFIQMYELTDPMVQVFVEHNFDQIFGIIQRISSIQVDQEQIEQFVLSEFPLTVGLYFHNIMNDIYFNHDIRQNYTKLFVEKHMNEIMEITMQQQFEFMADGELEFDWDKYSDELNECVKDELRRMFQNIDSEKVETGLNALFRGLEYDWTLFIDVLDKEFDGKQRRNILLHWLKNENHLEKVKILYLREFLQQQENEIRVYPLRQWIEVMEGRSTSKDLSNYYNSSFRSYLKQKFETIQDEVTSVNQTTLNEDFIISLEKQCLQLFLPSLINPVISGGLTVIKEQKLDFGVPPEESLDLLIKNIFSDAESSAYLDLKKRLMSKLNSLAKKYEVTQKRLTDFIVMERERFPKLAQQICQILIAEHVQSGQQKMVDLICSMEWSKQTKLIIGLLTRDISQEEILFAVMSNFLKDNRRKIERMTEDEMFSFVKNINIIDPIKSFVEQYYDSSEDLITDKNFNIQKLISNKKFPNLSSLFDVLEETKKNQLNELFERLNTRLSLKPKVLLELSEEIAAELTLQLNQEEAEVKTRLAVYTNRKIMEEYDFMMMERISEKLDEESFISDLMLDVKRVYAGRQIFKIFRTGIRSTVLGTEEIDWAQERSITQEISHELLDKVILQIALSTKV